MKIIKIVKMEASHIDVSLGIRPAWSYLLVRYKKADVLYGPRITTNFIDKLNHRFEKNVEKIDDMDRQIVIKRLFKLADKWYGK